MSRFLNPFALDLFFSWLFFLFCALLLSQGGLKGEGCHGFLEKVNGRMSVLCEETKGVHVLCVLMMGNVKVKVKV